MSSELHSHTFLGLREDADQSPSVVFLPLPLELTVSFGGGTRFGPDALLAATGQVELFDFELGLELDSSFGFRTVDAWQPVLGCSPDAAVEAIRDHVRPWIRSGAFCVGIGGEHTVTVPLLAELTEKTGPLTVLQIDAHADLRDEYEGSRYSHACVARRALEMGHRLILVGVRTFDRSEWDLCASNPLISLHSAPTLRGGEGAFERLEDELDAIEGPVYLTLDVDGLDPAAIPGTGTPEPGGLSYPEAVRIIDAVFTRCRVVGMDIVELAPIAGQSVSEFTSARLLVRAIARFVSNRHASERAT